MSNAETDRASMFSHGISNSNEVGEAGPRTYSSIQMRYRRSAEFEPLRP